MGDPHQRQVAEEPDHQAEDDEHQEEDAIYVSAPRVLAHRNPGSAVDRPPDRPLNAARLCWIDALRRASPVLVRRPLTGCLGAVTDRSETGEQIADPDGEYQHKGCRRALLANRCDPAQK